MSSKYAYETAQAYKNRILQKLACELDKNDREYNTAVCSGLAVAIKLVEATEPEQYDFKEVEE